ncbi:hypothetical protein [Calderihabitans maritimus]|uniref:Uncharacterized protein n=1 Tax=Calderihabitans maritimus TaxID=1246530 RepID=A0A1Z5HUH7_9FIRM|nr:hypothetical protein [Calderihabitans maritimus]GAW92981.1 hypothetical protein KKC1_21260 [Calderihabitans maritimus]
MAVVFGIDNFRFVNSVQNKADLKTCPKCRSEKIAIGKIAGPVSFFASDDFSQEGEPVLISSIFAVYCDHCHEVTLKLG